MIKKIEITNLFGIEGNNKNIEFNKDLTILVGLNGSGKTTILNILNIIFSKQFDDLINYQFKEIKVECKDQESIRIVSSRNLIFVIRTDIAEQKEPQLNKLIDELSKTDKGSKFRDLMDNILFINPGMEFDDTGRRYDSIKINEQQLYFYEPQANTYQRPNGDSRNEYFLLINRDIKKEKRLNYRNFNFEIESIYFPTYRRLETDFMDLLGTSSMYFKDDIPFQGKYGNNFLESISINSNGMNKTRTVVGYSNKDIEQLVRQKWNRINRVEAQSLNSLYSKFILSLLEPLSNEYDDMELDQDNKEYKGQLLEVFEKTKLISNNQDETIEKVFNYVEHVAWADEQFDLIGLDDVGYSEDNFNALLNASKIKESQKYINKLIKMYQDTIKRTQKFKKPFETLKEVLSIFLKKQVYFNDNNIYFKSGKDKLTFKDLSAGEKQLVSMLIYIWLDLKEGSIVMIDEPELSLHVTWQREFLSCLMMNTKKTQYIISTHSPFVIGKYKEKVVKIGETEEEFD